MQYFHMQQQLQNGTSEVGEEPKIVDGASKFENKVATAPKSMNHRRREQLRISQDEARQQVLNVKEIKRLQELQKKLDTEGFNFKQDIIENIRQSYDCKS